MSNKVDSEPKPKQQIGGESIIPIAALIFTLYYFYSIADSPWTAQVNAFMVGSILILVVGVFFYSRIKMLMAGEADLGFSKLLMPYDILGKRLIFIGITVGYLVAINWGGFTLTTFLFLWLSMMLLAGWKRPVFHAFLSVVMALVGWSAFIWLFETRLPKGPVEHLLAGLI